VSAGIPVRAESMSLPSDSFCDSGEGELHIDEKCFPVHAGEAFLIPADRIAWYRASAENPWRYAWAGFLGFQADSYFYQLMEAADGRGRPDRSVPLPVSG